MGPGTCYFCGQEAPPSSEVCRWCADTHTMQEVGAKRLIASMLRTKEVRRRAGANPDSR